MQKDFLANGAEQSFKQVTRNRSPNWHEFPAEIGSFDRTNLTDMFAGDRALLLSRYREGLSRS